MTSVPSATTWGSPTATKHALLIHGLTGSSHSWHRVASSLAAQGYFVTAPNLAGHALRAATDYRLDATVEDLRPYLEARKYSLIIGHSLGALVALALPAHLHPEYPTAIVLIDPPLRIAPESVFIHKRVLSEPCANIKRADAYAVENPPWLREDCIFRELATRLCPVETVHAVLEQNQPWDFVDRLDATRSNKWRVTALVADPALCMLCPVEHFQSYPHVRTVVVPGAGHCIYYDAFDVVVDEVLKTVAELDMA